MVFDEDTRTDLKSIGAVRLRERNAIAGASSEDIHELLGQVMAASARAEAASKSTQHMVQVLTSEVTQLRKDVEQDRHSLVRGASKHASNRAALLMSTLWGLWEIASPYLAELWRLIRAHK